MDRFEPECEVIDKTTLYNGAQQQNNKSFSRSNMSNILAYQFTEGSLIVIMCHIQTVNSLQLISYFVSLQDILVHF